jgi:hypothetical protein
MNKEKEQWHLSKNIPLTFVLTILMQTVALVWFISALNTDVEYNSKQIIRNETRITGLEKIVQEQAVTMGRIDENIKSIRQMMEKIMLDSKTTSIPK